MYNIIMFKPNLKLYLILIIILAILFILVLILPYGKREEKQISPTITPFPTSLNDVNRFQPIKPTPTIIHPTGTGGSEEVPPETLNFAQQKQQLKKKTPLTKNGFTITFDYANDMFIVTLVEPKDINRQVFQDWLKANYPAIPVSKFTLK